MSKKIQTNFNLYPKNEIVAIGDSQTDYTSFFGVSAGDNWSKQLSNRLNIAGGLTLSRAFGIGGDTMAEMLGRVGTMFQYSTPSLAIIYGGINDAGGAHSFHSATASSGSSTSITLTSNFTTNPTRFGGLIGNIITLTGGSGSGQTNTITSYDNATRIAGVSTTWITNPDSTTTYSIAVPTQSVIQANTQALIKSLKYAVLGYGAGAGIGVTVYNQTLLPANGSIGQRFVVMNDTSSTGGVPLKEPFHNTTITGNYSSSPTQSVWEFRNSQPGESGWGRVAISSTPTFSDGIQKIMILTQGYINWSGGGDNYNVTTSTGSKFSNYIPVRAAITAAASAESVALCDLYAFQSMLIYGGTFLGNTILSETTQGSYSWHWSNSDLHHNKYGHETIARACYLTAINQGWLTDLSS